MLLKKVLIPFIAGISFVGVIGCTGQQYTVTPKESVSRDSSQVADATVPPAIFPF
ncbi:hypothetical protein G7B40_023660 [Aetokthonos hydrillicola Thurmond2011]|jgi:hypothetical protein|uniref:Lipoprotein n=1 Tax=Aetokthonos hydrillicola Thurmond2011 TaxID=2712845 RepID=A0AAP5IEN7_9CYAN|nr:hypothetical protein [Aetokthonos hydrillicola]MBO3460252.1 hypothetical protein [Aetokthonos hydrillicola CCALA 1050]MBW4586985.1 hypothetical protein [Aetokthonos hydrillicola CCALA 1050]MDR9897540.1 hypothetical protein [Aetokthonos hydrillicola Thurmond2011]